ncbi:MAG: hypothetical protein ACRYFL_09750 [Janthinobacterium lividum]
MQSTTGKVWGSGKNMETRVSGGGGGGYTNRGHRLYGAGKYHI